jgi:hypothetical protein
LLQAWLHGYTLWLLRRLLLWLGVRAPCAAMNLGVKFTSFIWHATELLPSACTGSITEYGTPCVTSVTWQATISILLHRSRCAGQAKLPVVAWVRSSSLLAALRHAVFFCACVCSEVLQQHSCSRPQLSLSPVVATPGRWLQACVYLRLIVERTLWRCGRAGQSLTAAEGGRSSSRLMQVVKMLGVAA